MQWSPRADDLKVERFAIPTHLDYFLINLLSSNQVITNRIARLKLSSSEDLIYVGKSYFSSHNEKPKSG